MAVCYLDTDDEITDAVARLRDGQDDEVVFVVPPGARIATGRINFKLLAREAQGRDVRIAIASSDEQVRALATSAGVLAAATPDLASAALERGDPPPEPDSGEAQLPSEAISSASATARTPAARSRRGIALGGIVIVAMVLAVAVLALQNLTTAEVTLVPRIATLGPISLTVSADPAASEVDIAAGVIPAVRVAIPLSAEGTFDATGSEVSESRAGGTVTFSATAQEFDQEIAAGTRLRTPSGIEFQTTEAVVLPRGVGTSARIDAGVEAVASGPAGNVPSGALSQVPSLERQGISVTNAEPMSGGIAVQTPRVTDTDYDAAAVDLQNRLTGALAAALRDSDALAPGLVVFPETARLGTVSHDPPPTLVVGQGEPEFELSGVAAASVLVVDPTLVHEVLRARLSEITPQGAIVLDDSVESSVAVGTVSGDRIEFPGTVEAASYSDVKPDAIRTLVAGLPIPEARAILESFGETTVNVWPEFLGDLPGDGSRITVEVFEPTTSE